MPILARQIDANHKDLRPYQWKAAVDLSAYLFDGEQHVALVAPTGSGKSLMVVTILAKTIGRAFKSAVVAVPSIQIEDGFHSNYSITADPDEVDGSASLVKYELDKSFFLRPRKDTISNLVHFKAFLAAEEPTQPVMLTTHQQLAKWSLRVLPKSLKGHLLIIDEAHHVGIYRGEGTKIGKFARAWVKKGGTVLYVSATPFRGDDKKVFPESTKIHMWTITNHAESKFAPADFQIQTQVLDGPKARTPAELAGEALSQHANLKSSAPEVMAKRWFDDGKPKAVFIVPPKNSWRFTIRLIKAIKDLDPKCRLADAVGTDTKDQERFLEALDEERGLDRYEDSSWDVFVACKRFDEGTDWPMCSHVYNYGIPRNFGLIIQRWGRAFRNKADIEGYPVEHVNTARITFFTPPVDADVLDQFEQQHHDHAFLLACYMADWRTAQEYGTELRIRMEKHWERRPKPEGEGTDLETIRAEQEAMIPDHIRAQVRTDLAKWEIGFRNNTGRGPTVAEVEAYVDALGWDDVRSQAAAELITTLVAAEHADVLDDLDDGLSSLWNPVRTELKALFRSVVGDYRNKTFSVLGDAVSIYTSFTGRDAEEVAKRLGDRVHKPDLSMAMIEDAVRGFHEEHGKVPSSKGGDATNYFGFPETWTAVGMALSKGSRNLPGGDSLLHLARRMGLVMPKITLPMIKDAIQKFHEEHGKTPNAGDAACYFGFPATWGAVNARLRIGHGELPGGDSLFQVAVRMGLREGETTLPIIGEAIQKFYGEHGKTPNAGDGDASRYFGFPILWGTVNMRLSVGSGGLPGGESLHQVATRMGLNQQNTKFTLPMVEEAIQGFYTEHGEIPNPASGDASPYFGFPTKWGTVNARLLRGGRGLLGNDSLFKFCRRMGLPARVRGSKPNFTLPMIEEAIQKFHSEHGHYPNQTSGDASPYFGFPETWGLVNVSLYGGHRGLPGGNSLVKIARGMGFKPRKCSWRTGLTLPMIENAIRKFHEETGNIPVSGDASPYFGSPETWEAVKDALYRGGRGLPCGKSLAKIARKIGLETRKLPGHPNYRLTLPMIEKAFQNFHGEHGHYPTQTSGDASPYFGFSETWVAVNIALAKGGRGLPGGSSLVKYTVELGLEPRGRPKPSLTLPRIEAAIRKCHEETGKVPVRGFSDATTYFGFPETWVAVNQSLRKGLRGLPGGDSLHKLYKRMGLK